MSMKHKEYIADVCENLYMECLREIPQFEKDELIWILNGSTLCNFLYNVVKIDEQAVNDEFRKNCYAFIRQPKGDIDISYKADRPYKFDLDNKYIKEFQTISEEQRTYNFVDSNSELYEKDFDELCTMETKNGFYFVAKKPQYLFLYKFKEFLAVFNKEILNGDLDSIISKKKNMLSDVVSLYNIALSYCGQDEINNVLDNLINISSSLKKIYDNNSSEYYELIDLSFKIINDINNRKKFRM